MDIHAIYKTIFTVWRAKRMRLFKQLLISRSDNVLLDVGGYPWFWTNFQQKFKRIDCINTHPVDWDPDVFPEYRITTCVGDGCSLAFADASYDIVFSNSVIEHVGDWGRQQAFAHEVRRVGKRLWIQTPAYACPVEPHYLAFFVHWLPVAVRRRLLRRFTLWGWLVKPDQAKVDETIRFTRLLRRNQMATLFPDCRIITERLFGIFPKSYIAYR